MTNVGFDTQYATRSDPDLDPDAIVDESANRLWPGDSGSLAVGARRALVLLLKRHHIWAARYPKEWVWLLRWQDEITMRLNDLFLELVLDEGREIAYKRQAGRDQGRQFTTLLHDNVYTREEAGVLLYIREAYQREMRAGNDSAYVDRSGMADELDYVRPEGTKDHKKAESYLDNAIKNLTKEGFLFSDKTDAERLRISPVIEVLLTVERVHGFREALYVNDNDAASNDQFGIFGGDEFGDD
jgi:hypothetical protein